MTEQRQGFADYAGEIVMETPNAWRINLGDKVAWLPKKLVSVTEIRHSFGRPCTVTVPDWLAKRERII